MAEQEGEKVGKPHTDKEGTLAKAQLSNESCCSHLPGIQVLHQKKKKQRTHNSKSILHTIKHRAWLTFPHLPADVLGYCSDCANRPSFCTPMRDQHPPLGLQCSWAHLEGSLTWHQPRANISTRCGGTGHPDPREEGARTEFTIAGAGYPLQYKRREIL